MAFWDKVKEELTKAAQEGWGAVKEGAKVVSEKSREGARVAVEKSEEMAKVGKLRYKAHALHRDAEKLFGELGGMVYDMAKPPFENPLSNDEVMGVVEQIKKVEEEAAAVEKEADEVGRKDPAKETLAMTPQTGGPEEGAEEKDDKGGKTEKKAPRKKKATAKKKGSAPKKDQE